MQLSHMVFQNLTILLLELKLDWEGSRLTEITTARPAAIPLDVSEISLSKHKKILANFEAGLVWEVYPAAYHVSKINKERQEKKINK